MTPKADQVTLREHLEQRADFERTISKMQQDYNDLRFKMQQQFDNHRYEMTEAATKLQASEYERRLTALNHAHENAVKEQLRTTPREIHDQHIKDYDKFKTDTTIQLTAIATRSALLTVFVGIAVTALSLALQYFRG